MGLTLRSKCLFLFICLFFISESYSQSREIDSINYYIKNKDLLEGLAFAKEKSDYYLAKKDYRLFCQIGLKKAEIYYLLNDSKRSFQMLFSLLKTAEAEKLTDCRVEILEDIGHRYAAVRNFEKAKSYYYRSLTLAKKNNLLDANPHIYQRIFKVHSETESDSTFYYMTKIMQNAKKVNKPVDLAVSHNNYFAYYTSKENFDLAKKHLDTSISYAEKLNDPIYTRTAFSNLGYHYLVVEKDYKKGIKEYQRAFTANSKDSISQECATIYLNLAYAYEKIGDYKNALFYTDKYSTINEFLYKDNIKRAISDLETKYKIEKAEKENDEKLKIAEEKQKNNQRIILIFIALFVFSIVLFYFFYQNLRLKQKNKFIELDREIKQNIINASVDGKEIERKNIANILHDGISALLSSAGLHLAAYIANNPNNVPEEILKTKTILNDAHNNVRDLSHELIPPLLAKFGLFYALRDLAEKNSNSVLQFEYENYVQEGKRYNEEFEMRVYYIIAELFNNIMKHSNASKAYITLEEVKNQLHITIEDDGIGFDASKEHSSDGFGLTQIKSRIKHLNGTITINSKINAGTLIYIKLQIA